MTRTNPKVDRFIERATDWQQVIEKLREISLECGLTEDLKWGKPCYAHDGSNVAIVQPFKDSCAYMFFKGALLADPEGILEAPGANSRIAKRIPFAGLADVERLEPVVRAYIAEAVKAEEAGLIVEVENNPEPVPAELQSRLDDDPALKTAFQRLTPGRQRAYILHISSAKQSRTRANRVEKHAPRILEGKGMND